MNRIVVLGVMCMLIFLTANGQNASHEFDFQQTIGELTAEDLVKEQLGRYDGFEIPLYKGELLQSVLYTEAFNPTLILVAPDGKTIRQSIGEQYNFARISLQIPEDGDYLLYVVSKDRKTGQYFLQNAFGPEPAFSLPENASFCDKISYINAHARASFQLLGGSDKSSVIIDGTIKSFLDGEDGSYHSILYEGKSLEESLQIMNSLKQNVAACLGDRWRQVEENWKNEGDYRLLDYIFSGKDNVGNNLRVILRIHELKNKNIDPLKPVSLEIVFKIVQ